MKPQLKYHKTEPARRGVEQSNTLKKKRERSNAPIKQYRIKSANIKKKCRPYENKTYLDWNLLEVFNMSPYQALNLYKLEGYLKQVNSCSSFIQMFVNQSQYNQD